jgi:hypothetical protein
MDLIHPNGPSGRIIHLVNCTYCKHRVSVKKGIEGKYELELCGLSRRKIPSPSEPGRYCDYFQKTNCPCVKCNEIITIETNY